MQEPLVSVVIPFYSNVNWLMEALNSVQEQSYKNIEVLVINDGSKENVSLIKDKYDMDLRIINKENGGPASARNLGIEKSSGKYIAFLDSDDIWLPDKLQRQIKFMEEKNSIWSHHSYEMFWENYNKTKIIYTSTHLGDVYKDCFISFKVQTSCVVVLKKVLKDKKIQFPIEKRYGQDVEFYRSLAKYYPLHYIDDVLSKFRIRGSNAGFRAYVQLNDRAAVWNDIKNDQNVLNILPKPIIFAYKTSNILSKYTNKVRLNEPYIEWLSKILYTFPYLTYKKYSRK